MGDLSRWPQKVLLDTLKTPYNGPDGQVSGLIGVSRDITERRQDEDRLRLDAIVFQSTAEGVAITDPRDVIMDVNQAFERITGYTRDEILGNTPRMLKSGRHDDAFYTEIWRIIHAQGQWSGEIWNRRKSGEIYPEWLSINGVRDNKGKITHFVAVFTDITERKHTEDELHQYRVHLEQLVETRTTELEAAKESAESANRAKSAFLAHMSHEIRTPLNGLFGMIDMLRLDQTEEKRRRHLDVMDRSAHALLRIINDILDFSRIEAGMLELLPEPLDPVQVAQDVTALFSEEASRKGLALEVKTQGGIASSLLGDISRLRQILLNLVSNATKFTEHGGVCLHIARVAESSDFQTLRFTVEDTGIGISSAIHEHIFHAFAQADDSSTRKQGGNGLGLAISSRLVELMGGSLSLESQPGHGSCFWFESKFPIPGISMGMAGQQATTSVSDTPLELGLRVLLVEDNPVN